MQWFIDINKIWGNAKDFIEQEPTTSEYYEPRVDEDPQGSECGVHNPRME